MHFSIPSQISLDLDSSSPAVARRISSSAMAGTLKVLSRHYLVRDLVLACLGTGALVWAGSNGWVDVEPKKAWLALGAYILLAPNKSLFFKPRRPKRRSAENNPKDIAPKTLAEAVKEMGPPTGERYVVLGGLGFVGERIAKALYARGERNIVCVSRSVSDTAKAKFEGKIEIVQADVLDKESLRRILKGTQVVFAPVAEMCFSEWMPHHYKRNGWKNPAGMQNIIECATEAGVKRLIFTGSSTTLFTSEMDLERGYDDSCTYATKNTAVSLYGYGKAQSEQMVLAANGKNGLATGLIRPFFCVIGYGDKNFIDRVVVPSGIVPLLEDCPVELVDVDDVIYAEMLLEKRLRNGPTDEAAGEAFNVASDRSYYWTEFVHQVDVASKEILNGHRALGLVLPQRFLWLLVAFVDTVALLLPFDVKKVLGNDLGILTVSTMLNGVAQPTMNEEWRNEKAQRILGYQPLMSLPDTIRRTLTEMKNGRVAHFNP